MAGDERKLGDELAFVDMLNHMVLAMKRGYGMAWLIIPGL